MKLSPTAQAIIADEKWDVLTPEEQALVDARMRELAWKASQQQAEMTASEVEGLLQQQ